MMASGEALNVASWTRLFGRRGISITIVSPFSTTTMRSPGDARCRRAGARSAAVSVSASSRICQRQTNADQFPENMHSQEQAPGITPENLASPVATAAELTPENVELLASYSCPGGRAAAAPGGDLGDVLVDGGAADAEQPGDGGDGVVRSGQQVAGVAERLRGHGRGPAETGATGAGGVQSLAGALDDQLADELRQRGEDVEDQPAAGVVVSRASCRLLNPTPRRRSVPPIWIRSASPKFPPVDLRVGSFIWAFGVGGAGVLTTRPRGGG
jgi:hypothetical protein